MEPDFKLFTSLYDKGAPKNEGFLTANESVENSLDSFRPKPRKSVSQLTFARIDSQLKKILQKIQPKKIGAYFLKPTTNETYLVYLEDSRIRFLCPWCGRAHTTPVARQLHLLLFPRINSSCNETSESIVSCNVCKLSTKAYNFDLHPCTLTFINKLDDMLLTSDVSIDAVDYCIICGTLHGCKYGLFSHLLVYHFPNAGQYQCGYCGKSGVVLELHEKLHKHHIRTVSNKILNFFLEASRFSEINHLRSSKVTKFIYNVLLCFHYARKIDNPVDVFLHFIYPYSCVLCGTFRENHEDLQRHILYDSHDQLPHRKLELFLHIDNKYLCRYCKGTKPTLDRKPCLRFYDKIKSTKAEVPKFHFSAHRTCLLCWNRNLRVHQLMVHIPVRHNLSLPGVCGLCNEKTEPGHERKHEKELNNRIGLRNKKQSGMIASCVDHLSDFELIKQSLSNS